MEKKTSINLRVSEIEKKTLKKLAHKSEMNLSEFLRFKGLTNLINNN
jgi:predicted DNA binding CopG/RHH family protein